MEVAERRLGLAHPKRHELAGRIVHVHQQHRAGSTVLEPVMVRAVDLHELAVAITTVTRLLDTLVALTARQPDAVVDHPLPECLGGHTDVVLFEKLFLRERRSKVRIARPDEPERFVSKLHGQTSIALAACSTSSNRPSSMPSARKPDI